nr:hypothetical protein [Actinomycetota bacterium]
MATKTHRRPPAKRPVQHPKSKASPKRRPYGWIGAGIVIVLALGGAFVVARDDGKQSSGPTSAGDTATAAGLPNTPDYHSLLVAPGDRKRVFL